MSVATDEIARATALHFARGFALFLDTQSAPRPLGVYLIGSLAHGGFSRRYSDIDMALVTEQGLSQSALDAIRTEAAALSPDLASKLSLFWSDRHFSIGRFPPLDRVDYLDHAVSLVERERVQPPRPTLKEIRAYLSGAPLENWAESARRFAILGALDVKEHKSYLRTLLYPARFVYSWITGGMASNDDAVALLNEQRPAEFNINLVAEALELAAEDELSPRPVRRGRKMKAAPKKRVVPKKSSKPIKKKRTGSVYS